MKITTDISTVCPGDSVMDKSFIGCSLSPPFSNLAVILVRKVFLYSIFYQSYNTVFIQISIIFAYMKGRLDPGRFCEVRNRSRLFLKVGSGIFSQAGSATLVTHLERILYM